LFVLHNVIASFAYLYERLMFCGVLCSVCCVLWHHDLRKCAFCGRMCAHFCGRMYAHFL